MLDLPVSRARLLVVDADPSTAPAVLDLLGAGSVELQATSNWSDGYELLQAGCREGRAFDVVFLAQSILRETEAIRPRIDGLQPKPHVVVLIEDASLSSAIDTTFDQIGKPPSRGELLARVQRAIRDRLPAPKSVRRPRKSDVIIGAGDWIKDLYDQISMAAPTDVTIAVYGESGTGKELVARTIHALSNRYQLPFVVVNCAAIPEALLEDELFGHVKGAFTDAAEDRPGLFATADRGTIFLDEIGEMPLPLQAKLLRVLQSHEFRPIGGNAMQSVDVRILAATNKELEHEVSRGRFREDLFYRINVFPVVLPALRQRREDIPLLAHHFLRKHGRSMGKNISGFEPGAMERLVAHDFPGNVRELENRVHRGLVMATGSLITEADLDIESGRAPISTTIDLARPFRELKQEAVARFEQDYLIRLLTRYRGNLAAAARAAGVDRKNLWAMAKKRGVDPNDFRPS